MKLSCIALFLCVSSCKDDGLHDTRQKCDHSLGVIYMFLSTRCQMENSAFRDIPYHGQVYPQSVSGDFEFLGCKAKSLTNG